MKLLLLCIALVFASCVSAQGIKAEIKERVELSPTHNGFALLDPKLNDTIPNVWKHYDFRKQWNGSSRATTQQKSLILDPEKPGVYSLRIDNMPCIVPNTKDIAAIPNHWKGGIRTPFKGNIPNPAQPKVQIVPREDVTK